MTAKAPTKKDVDAEVGTNSPKRTRMAPLMISAEEVRRLVESEEPKESSEEGYAERVAKELRVKITELRAVRCEVSDPQWLRTPWLWPQITEDLSTIIDEHCLPGVITRAFMQSAELLWESATVKQLNRLRQDFINVMTVFEAVRTLPPKIIVERIRPMIRQAYELVHSLNEEVLPSEARMPYRLAVELAPSRFGLGEEAAMKKAVYAIKPFSGPAGSPHQTKPQRFNQLKKGRPCRSCGEVVLDFKGHNKTCKKQ